MSCNVGKNKLDLDSLAKSITEGATKTKSLFSSARIHKVPEELRKLNESAYNPHLIAIGPLHHGKEQLQKPMEDVKIGYTYYLLARLDKGGKTVEDKVKKLRGVLEECATKMEECVDTAKKYYAEELTVDDHDMAKMMLFDGCFILELLYASYHDKETKEAGKSTTKGGDSGNSKASSSCVQQPTNEGEDSSKDPILDNILINSIIKHDLFLFENQIPFFVLDELFKLTVDQIPKDHVPGGKKLPLTEYVDFYFHDIVNPEGKNNGSELRDESHEMKPSCCLPSDCILSVCDSEKENEQEKMEQRKANHDYDHILHLLHDYYLPGDQGGSKKLGGVKQNCALPCCRTPGKKFSALEIRASELHYGGVKFVPVERNNDVKFREPKSICWWLYRATFEIPTVNIHNPTESFLRNLIAFEQFRPGVERYFTSYAKLMDVLINSKKDVEVLSRANVIRNLLGTDKDVCELLNKLCKEVVGGFFFEEACQQAFEYSQRCWPRYMAYWRRTYFTHPWTFKGACLVLALFLIQFINFVRSFLK